VLNRLFKSSRRRPDPAPLYDAIVDQAREPAFFTHCGIADTVYGRYDLLVLHAFLVFRRLNTAGERLEDFRQALFDHMFRDMDASLREIGVGDLSVPKKIKKMAKGFYGKVVAYEKALAADDAALAETLRRDLYSDAEPTDGQVAAVADYVRAAANRVDAQPVDALLAGRVDFGPAPQVVGESQPA
jgi:cytochrome b pre-mRNA-processing protein 3